MHNKNKSLISKAMVLLLTIIIIGNGSIAMAVSDVPSSFWANTQVNSVVDQDLMPLYTGDNFKPDSIVTNLEVVTAIYKTVKAAGLLDNVQMGTITTKYEADLKTIGIPQMLAPYDSDVYPALAYALEYNILTLDEVKVFVSGSTLTNVKKVNAAVLISKALNVYKQENLNKIILLSYKDSAEISLSAIKYVNFLIEQGIISNKGDNEGKFNPNSTINRTLLAIMIDGLSKELTEGSVTQPATETSTEDETEDGSGDSGTVVFETEKIVKGTVKAVNDGDFSVTVTTTAGRDETYILDEAQVAVLGTLGSFNNITLGVNIVLTVKNGVVTKAELDKKLLTIEGNVVQLTDYIGVSQNRRSLKVAVSDKSNEFRSVYDDTIVTINGLPSKATDLSPGDKVIVLYEGFDAKRIIAYSENYEFYGILDNNLETKTGSDVVITMESGNVFKGSTKTIVNYVGSNASYKKGDIVKATLKFGEIVKLEWIGQAKTVVGKISGINIKKNSELTLTLTTGKDETYGFATKAKLLNETGDNNITIYDLRLDQEVTIDIGIGGITKMQLGRKIIAEPTAIKATISQVVDSSNVLLVTDENNRQRTITFPVGSIYKATNFKAGMVVFIEGKAIADTIFEVIKITVQSE
jgi:S-layer homology domain.